MCLISPSLGFDRQVHQTGLDQLSSLTMHECIVILKYFVVLIKDLVLYDMSKSRSEKPHLFTEYLLHSINIFCV